MVPVAFALVAQQVPAPVLFVALCSVARMAFFFFPISAVFALVWGFSVSGWGIFALAIVFLGCYCGVAVKLRLPVLRLGACGSWPCSFSRRPSSQVVPACFCGSFLMRRSCVFLLSSCSARGRRLLSLLLVLASVPLPAAPAVFRGVSCRRLPLGGYAPFLAPDACPAPAVELCL